MTDILFLVPPFFSTEFQSLALHNLQACTRAEGYSADIRYINFEVAKRFGEYYNLFCQMNYFQLGERIFAKAAWGDQVGEQFYDGLYNYRDIYNREKSPVKFFNGNRELTIAELKECEVLANSWLTDIEQELKNLNYRYVGVMSSFEQINVGVCLLKMVKKHNSGITTFMGGFNCEHEMAEGILSLDRDTEFLDYIFNGESERSLIDLLKNGGSENRIIRGEPIQDLDVIPDLDYSDYFNQQLEEVEHISLVMEHSRGCWWGEKSQCTFCGTSDRVGYRQKSLSRIKEELESAKKWGVKRLHTADLIMPDSHLTDLLPYLKEQDYGWRFYFEQKVSLKFHEMKLLKDAGVIEIQPGIESLSNNVLKLMAKGTTVKQNITFLRDATTLDFELFWNMVWGVPGETIEDYREMNSLIPLLVHLIPPIGIFHMTMVRFSPYFRNPDLYGIEGVEPIPSYRDVYPSYADIDKIAIIFRCHYREENLEDPTEIERLIKQLDEWNTRWNNTLFRPRLEITRQGSGEVILLDTRGLEGCDVKTEVDSEFIRELIEPSIYSGSALQKTLLEKKVAIKDGKFIVPLVVIGDEIRREYGEGC